MNIYEIDIHHGRKSGNLPVTFDLAANRSPRCLAGRSVHHPAASHLRSRLIRHGSAPALTCSCLAMRRRRAWNTVKVVRRRPVLCDLTQDQSEPPVTVPVQPVHSRARAAAGNFEPEALDECGAERSSTEQLRPAGQRTG